MSIHRVQRAVGAFLAFTFLLLSVSSFACPDSAFSAGFAKSALHSSTVSLLQRTEEQTTFVPQKVYALLKKLDARGGAPLPGYVGGREFYNRERLLPSGRYREYDVNPKKRGQGRDAERIVIEQRTKKAYYTKDHYRSFVPLN